MNKYYTHLSVKDAQEAAVFSNVHTWTIIDVLRKSGAKGLTAEEVHRKVADKMHLDISRSKIYGLLKRMYEEKLVHRYYDKEVQINRNTLTLHSGEVGVNKEFDEMVVTKEKKYLASKLFPVFLEYLDRARKDIYEDPSAKKWLPQPKLYCKICNRSHEAEEFFNSMLDIASAEFLESKGYVEFMKKNYYAGDEEPDEDYLWR